MTIRTAMTALTALFLLSCSAKEAPESIASSPAQPAVAAPISHDDAVMAWRAERVERLRRTDGWLSLVGLHWLADGQQSIGSDASADVVLAAGPAQLGTIDLTAGVLHFRPDATAQGIEVVQFSDDAWTVAATNATYLLMPDSAEHPNQIRMGDGFSVTPIERGGKLGLRVKDANAPTRTEFTGLDYFDISKDWRIEAKWVAHKEPANFEIQNVLGMVELMPNPGYAVFERDGKEFRLYPVIEVGESQWFFIFADRTSGRETYGPGRFLYAEPVADGGTIILDFNRAYNPPCAFTEFSTCPLPPPENRLDLAVQAGEKKYRAASH